MNLVNVYKEALQNVKLDDIEFLENLIIPLHPSISLKLTEYNINYHDYTRPAKYVYHLKTTTSKSGHILLEQEINENEWTELKALILEKRTNLILEFLNTKYTNFPQAPKELQNDEYNGFN